MEIFIQGFPDAKTKLVEEIWKTKKRHTALEGVA